MDGELNKPPRDRSPFRDPWVWAVLGVALVLRFAYLVDLRHTPFFSAPQMDALYHDGWARRLAAGGWWGGGVFFRAPLYPYFLGAVYAIFGPHPLAPRVIQFLIGGGTAWLTALVGYRALGRTAAIAAGFLVALHGPLIYYEGELLLVVLEAPLFLLAAWSLYAAGRENTGGRWIRAGLLAGIGALVRPTLLALLPVVAVHLGWKRGRGGVRPFALYAGGVLIAIAPALLHNALAGDLVPIASQGGLNFYLGNNPAADGMAAVAPEFRRTWTGGVEDAQRLAEIARGGTLRPSQVSDYWFERAFAWARESPGAFLALQVKKFAYFWDAFEIPNNEDYDYFSGLSRLFRAGILSGFWLLGPLALAGLIAGLARRRLPFAWVAVPLTLTAVIVAFFVCGRFRAPLTPLFAAWGGVGLAAFFEDVRSGAGRRAAGFAALLVLFAIGVNADPWGHRARHTFRESYLRLGIFYAGEGKSDAAEEAYRRAVAEDPKFADAWNNLGVLQAQRGRWGEARDALVNALTVEPNHPKALSNLAALAFQEGRSAEADSLARRTLRVAGREPEALYNAAVVLGNLGDAGTAREAFRALLALEPGNAAARVGEAKALLALGRREDALATLRTHPPDRRSPELEALLHRLEGP